MVILVAPTLFSFLYGINVVLFVGGIKYLIKGCSGQGGFAQVFKAFVDSNPDEVVALKVTAIFLFFLLPRPLFFFNLKYAVIFFNILTDTKACLPLGILYVPTS